MNDTLPEITERVRQMLLERTPAERMAMGSQMFEAARAIILASLPAGLSATEVRRRLCERLYGDEVDTAAFSRRLDTDKRPAN